MIKTKKQTKKIVKTILANGLILLIALAWLIPIVWVLLASFREEKGIATTTIFPKNYTLQNYVNLFKPTGYSATYIKFTDWFINTLTIAGLNCIISTILTLGAAYALSRFRFKFRKPYLNIALVLGMFPGFMSMIAIYFILNEIGMIDEPLALLLVYSAGAGLGFYTAKGYFETISVSLDESAMIDGASQMRIFFSIILPLSKPIIIYTAVTAFMTPWMDFILASMVLTSPEQKTVAVGLYGMIMDNADLYNNFTTFAAGCVIVSIPTIILYIALQKYMISGITAGAVK